MSRQGLEAFVTAAQGDPALADGAARAAAGRGEAESLHAVASFARERGYDVGEDELAAAWREASMARTDGELSDSELGAVSGGTDILRKIWNLSGTILG